MGFRELIRYIVDGEPVTGGVASRAPRDIQQNVQNIKDRLDASLLGETIVAYSRVVEVDAKAGMPVYYRSVSAQFERALAQVEMANQAFVTSVSSQVWGVILEKTSDVGADILLQGIANVNLTESIDGTPEVGALYYLSGTEPGKLTTNRPPAGVIVLQCGQDNGDGTHEVYVNPRMQDLVESHRHYKFNLIAEPAGTHTPPSPGNRHLIGSPDNTQEGWLPASDAIFGGKAPPGAAWGYNISVSDLADVWPPQPVEGAYLEWNKGEDKEILGQGVPIGWDQLCVIDRNGIWWMSDCYDDVPWPTSWTGPLTSDTESIIECPRLLYPVMVLWFTKPSFYNTASWVESLQVRENSGLILTCLDTNDAATTGHLLLDLDLSLRVGDVDRTGYLAFKELDDDGTFHKGPVAESIAAGTSNVTLQSDVPPTEDGKYYGNILVNVDLNFQGKEIGVDTVRLEGVEEEYYAETIALGFRAGRRSAFRGRVHIPGLLDLPDTAQLKFRFWILNRSNVDVPADIFKLTYRRIGKPVALETAVNLPTDVDEVTLTDLPTTDVTITTINQYFMLESDALDITRGDIVHFTLTREGDTDGYSGDLMMLRQRGVYVIPVI